MSANNATARGWPLFFPVSERMRSAVKVALSLTLAFMIPMAAGWNQPSTAAITVMIIAAAGDTRQSLMAGTLRLGGTLLGAIIGLSLVACFAQDRLYYLLSVSLAAATFLYLYSAFRGDGTVFMLTAVVTLLVFNGGDAENAFLYGVDRAFMTMFGVAVHTLVCSFLWPDKTESNLEQDARNVLQRNAQLLRALRPDTENPDAGELLQSIAAGEAALADNWRFASSRVDDVASYQREWRCLIAAQRTLSRTLGAALEPADVTPLNYSDYIQDYAGILAALEQRFTGIDEIWSGSVPTGEPAPIAVCARRDNPVELPHLVSARIAARLACLREVARILDQIRQLSICLSTRADPLALDSPAASVGRFQWLDGESIKLGLRVFIGFWLATAVWILFNPPGGFVFVTMSTLLLPLVSFTPLSPVLLYILFSLGFAFALPSYVFLLPGLSEGYELALFLFTYTLFGHYVFKGPVAIFFMLGLMTLGIGNTMHYDLGVLLNVMFMFYLVITCLVFINAFVFNGKPEYLFNTMRRRFFRQTERLIALRSQPVSRLNQWRERCYADTLDSTLAKMKLWASKVDTAYFAGSDTAKLMAFVSACELLRFRTSAIMKAPRAEENSLLHEQLRQQFRDGRTTGALQVLAGRHIDATAHQRFVDTAINAGLVERGLDAVFEQLDTDSLGDDALANFYNGLNQAALFWHGLIGCDRAMQEIDWPQLQQSRF